MDNKQKQLVKILSLAIGRENSIDLSNEEINWKDIINEAESHSIKALIYSTVKNMGLLKEVEGDILNQWKKETILTGVSQINHVNTVGYILSKFNKENIPVIVLKGLVVRDLYPNPEFRTMGDADILVHEKDLDKVRKLFNSLGYTEDNHGEGHGAHIVFSKAGFRHIEVHWTLINEQYFKGTNEFEKSIWDNTMEINLKGVKALSLGLDDLALHLCVHMAVHIACGGFGLRQLCDLVLLVEKEGKNINWNTFMKNGRECGVEKFIVAIFICCNKLFHMEIPKEIVNNNIKIDHEFLDLLIQDIFQDGVFGKGDISRGFDPGLAYDKEEIGEENKQKAKIFKKFIRIIFPPVEKMSHRYSYAKNNKLFIPIAWIHHLFAGVFNKEYKLKDKIRFVTSTVSTSKKRNKLLNWLEL